MIPGKDNRTLEPAHETDGPTELNRLFEVTLQCLKSTDLYGANAALKKVHDEAALAPGSRRNEERTQGSGG